MKPTVPSVLRGSLIRLRRKCGKARCHCLQGKAHISPALSYSRRGKTKILTLPKDILPQVRVAIGRYLRAQTRLQAQADAGLRQLTRQLRSLAKSKP